MKYIYFLKYNNYANRIMKREDTLDGYLGEYEANVIQSITDCKLWNPNDGITTVITTPLNSDFSVEPDYLITVDDLGHIDSKWFIVETVRTLKGQYDCVLRRDVFAEAWDDLMNSYCYMERAVLDKYNPLIFNPEPITVNQILENEQLIVDKSYCPWIVFYGETNISGITVSRGSLAYQLEVDDINDFCSENTFYYLPDDANSVQLGLVINKQASGRGNEIFNCVPYGISTGVSSPTGLYIGLRHYISFTGDPEGFRADVLDVFTNTDNLKTSADYGTSYTYNNIVVHDRTTDKYYRIQCVVGAEELICDRLTNDNSSPYIDQVKDILDDYTNFSSVVQSGYSLNTVTGSVVYRAYKRKKITTSILEELDSQVVTIKTPDNSYNPVDAPYHIWCMPYKKFPVTYKHNGVSRTLITDPDLNLRAAQAISIANTSSKIYDLQILPFCPLPDEFFPSEGHISVNIDDNDHITDVDTMVDSNNDPVGFIFSCPAASFKKQYKFFRPITATYDKVDSITKMYRLYSPNYASSFEFSVQKNGGLTGFNIRCTYMPINPYIRIAPIWGGLYGTNDDEVRGLICQGDFSLPRLQDAWVQYQEQNKNYQAIFNREIDHMDVNRHYESIQQHANAITGALSAGISGAAAGGIAGGGAGAVLGGVFGFASSLGAGAADLYTQRKLYEENRSYATDMYQLNLGNIKAMPRSLARTTAFNVDNRYFPVFATYTCTDTEKNMVCEFVKNRSMSVGVYDTPSHYVSNTWSYGTYRDRGFIQGRIININTTHDTHFVDALNDEFQRGVYLR